MSPALPLAAMAAELADGPAGRLATGEVATDIRAVFSWSCHGPEPSRPRGCSGCSACIPGPDISAAAAASLAGLPLPDARKALAELAAAQLIQEQRRRAGSPRTTCCAPTRRSWPTLGGDTGREPGGGRAGCWITTCAPRVPLTGCSTRSRSAITVSRPDRA